MSPSLDAIRPITVGEIESARDRIAPSIVRTPLVRLELGSGYPEIRLKLENLQPTNAYKLRGAVNAVAMLSESARRQGVWTISAGNAGQGIAYAARQAGVPCAVVVIETAPAAKIERMKTLGAQLIPVAYAVAWKALDEHSFPGMDGTFVHPFDNHNFIAGHGTMGLEILEDAARYGGGHCGNRWWRSNHGHCQRDKDTEAGRQSLGCRAGDGRAGRALVCAWLCPRLSTLAALVRRWSWRQKRLSPDVGADETDRGRLHRGHPRANETSNANDGGKSPGHCRRRGCARIGRRSDRAGRSRPNRRDCFRWQH